MHTATTRRWRRAKPDCDGWWTLNEDGWVQRLLIQRGHVVSDDQWEQAMGRPPDDVWCENYWAGSSLDELPDGLWMFDCHEPTVGN